MSLWKRFLSSGVLIVLVLFGSNAVVIASQSSSPNYQVNEVFFGAGGDLNECSTTYCAKDSIGETGVGDISSTNYQAQAGFNTDRTPYLQFIVNTTSVNLGILTTASATYTTATFSVKSYLAGSYTVINASPPPQNNSYTMHSLTSPTASIPGTEQFGINLVANTSPATFGVAPLQVPGTTFSYGQVAAGYNTANLYKYVQGDTIAYSNQSSGETDYTISYIYNISSVTPGGTYTMNHVLVATSTF
jgi:hypothetical protein